MQAERGVGLPEGRPVFAKNTQSDRSQIRGGRGDGPIVSTVAPGHYLARCGNGQAVGLPRGNLDHVGQIRRGLEPEV